jgi:response regulator of citrate/malate metabolism
MSESSNKDEKMMRDEYPSGWLVLTRNEAVAYIVDALLDLPPTREFNQSELAREAGVSRQSVAKYRDLLLGAGVIEPIEGTGQQRYQFNPESPVSKAIIQVDGEMNAAGAKPDSE